MPSAEVFSQGIAALIWIRRKQSSRKFDIRTKLTPDAAKMVGVAGKRAEIPL
jgi:hypothetical protein